MTLDEAFERLAKMKGEFMLEDGLIRHRTKTVSEKSNQPCCPLAALLPYQPESNRVGYLAMRLQMSINAAGKIACAADKPSADLRERLMAAVGL